MPLRNKIKKLFINNWKPKYICLALAILMWVWVDHFYGNSDGDASDEWDEDAILFSLPE